jgi:hypothetical protein
VPAERYASMACAFASATPHMSLIGTKRTYPRPCVNRRLEAFVAILVSRATGISPKALPANGRAASRSTQRERLRSHYCGNAEGSTLRRTLGCLLSTELNICLRRVGTGSRYTFTNPGEQALDQWMDQHAFVTWIEAEKPWLIEHHLLRSGLWLPLNMDGNPCQEDVTVLKTIRYDARCAADQLEVVFDSGGPRRRAV